MKVVFNNEDKIYNNNILGLCYFCKKEIYLGEEEPEVAYPKTLVHKVCLDKKINNNVKDPIVKHLQTYRNIIEDGAKKFAEEIDKEILKEILNELLNESINN